MTSYDQKNQQVYGNQYNIGGNIYFTIPETIKSFTAGLNALREKKYDIAIEIFSNPESQETNIASYRYYLSISIMKGRRPSQMSYQDIRKIENNLNYIPKESDFFAAGNVLLSIIKSDYYTAQGMPEKGEKSEKLFEHQKNLHPSQAKILIDSINASGNKFYDHLKLRFSNE